MVPEIADESSCVVNLAFFRRTDFSSTRDIANACSVAPPRIDENYATFSTASCNPLGVYGYGIGNKSAEERFEE